MNLEIAKKLIKEYTERHANLISRTMIAERYYRSDNDIMHMKKKEDNEKNPLHNADNRVAYNFHGLLVNQKAAYMFTYPPIVDVENETANKIIADTLGDKWAKTCKKLCINASNSGVGWLHVWKDAEGQFKYAAVDSKQIIPVFSDDLEETLLAVLRVYRNVDHETGETYDIYEYWTDTQCQAFRKRANTTIDKGLEAYCMFTTVLVDTRTEEQTDLYSHGFGQVPFIPFFNNDIRTGDLDNIKNLIDTYDKTYSGFANDLEDIQEVIFVLSGYEGEKLSEFLGNMKKYKSIKVNGEEGGAVNTLTIDIPVEARDKLLDMTRKAIFQQGQGVDPNHENFGNASGVALKYLYSLLELKAGLLETEFRLGIAELTKMICKHFNIKCGRILQTWTRNAIQNDLEQSQICQASVGIASNKTIRKSNPLVDDIEAEEKQIEKEKAEEAESDEMYQPITQKQSPGQEGEEIDEQ